MPGTLFRLSMVGVWIATMLACAAAPDTHRTFSRDWAFDQRRMATEKRLKERELYVLGEQVRPPGWLKLDEDARADLPLSKSGRRTVSLSVDREEVGLRWRWGPRPSLPPPPGADATGEPPASEAHALP